jgi:hypothetical protein
MVFCISTYNITKDINRLKSDLPGSVCLSGCFVFLYLSAVCTLKLKFMKNRSFNALCERINYNVLSKIFSTAELGCTSLEKNTVREGCGVLGCNAV